MLLWDCEFRLNKPIVKPLFPFFLIFLPLNFILEARLRPDDLIRIFFDNFLGRPIQAVDISNIFWLNISITVENILKSFINRIMFFLVGISLIFHLEVMSQLCYIIISFILGRNFICFLLLSAIVFVLGWEMRWSALWVIVRLLNDPVDELGHLSFVLNHGKWCEVPDLLRTVNILIIFDLLEDDIDVDNIIAFSLLVVFDDLAFKCLVMSPIEDVVDQFC